MISTMSKHNKFNIYGFKQDYYKHYNLKEKWLAVNANILFNRTYTKNDLTRQYAKIKNKPFNKVSHTTTQHHSKLRIHNELKFLYKKKDYLSLQLYGHDLQIMKLHDKFWHIMKFDILEKLTEFTTRKYEHFDKNLQRLHNQRQELIYPNKIFFNSMIQ